MPQGNHTGRDDGINELPDDILSFILSFLTMRDAVKLRLLSRRWRYLCASTPDLCFDYLTIFGINYNQWDMNRYRGILLDFKHEFVNGVDQFLQQYRGPKMNYFRVSFYHGNESACYIDGWISSVVRMEAEKIDLNFSIVSRGVELYNFPCHILPRGKKARLKHLCLGSRILRPSFDLADRLGSLKTLELNDVPLDHQSDIKNILSGCLSLEFLRLINCNLHETLGISGQFLRLKSLFVVQMAVLGQLKNIELSSINLRTFEYKGIVINFTFIGVPLLDKMYLWFTHPFDRGTNYMFNGLAKDLPQFQILSLVFMTRMTRPIPSSMTELSYLKQLELFIIASINYHVLPVTFILNASSLLQKFHPALREGGWNGPRHERMYCKHLHFQLKEVEISGFEDRWNLMELAIYLLNNAIALEQMVINPQSRLYHGGDRLLYSGAAQPDELKQKQACDLLVKEKVDSNSRADLIFL